MIFLFLLRPPAIVDRIEDDVAVLEWPDGSFSDVPRTALPPEIQEGDRLAVRRANPLLSSLFPASATHSGWRISPPASRDAGPRPLE